MRKLIIAVIAAIGLVGCINEPCIAQVPSQVVDMDENCIGVMPDVLQFVTVEDCSPTSIVQIPAAGTNIAPPIDAKVVVVDAAGNVTEADFVVTGRDVIAPKIIWGGPIAELPPDWDTTMYHYTQFYTRMQAKDLWLFNYGIGLESENIPEEEGQESYMSYSDSDDQLGKTFWQTAISHALEAKEND